MNDLMWKPQEGPQLDAILCAWCDELMFGGARGGGKSEFLLGDFLQDVTEYEKHWQGILFRRTYPELQQLIQRSQSIYAPTGAIWREKDKDWTWPNGAKLRLRFLEYTRDASRYQGHSYCVGVDTLILMADGSSKPISDIVVGDLVMTLNGPKFVLEKIEPYKAKCVRAETSYGSQIQPIWHPVLTALGWRSYASILESGSRGFEGRYSRLYKHPSVSMLSRLFQPPECPNCGRQHNDFPNVYYSFCKLNELSDVSNEAFEKPFLGLLSDWVRVYEPLKLDPHRIFLSCFSGDNACVKPDRKKEVDLQDHCPFCHHFYDVRLHDRLKNAQEHIPLQDDVEQPCHVDYKQDEEGNILINNPPLFSQREYCHPYSGRVLTSSVDTIFDSCKMTPCGTKWVTDLQIQDVNHYISSDTLLVNKNTWIGFDELTQWPSDESYNMLKACLRWGEADVSTKRIRATANPGGPGHTWVKRYFVDPCPTGSLVIEDERTSMSRMFIRSRITDNKILLANDPFYIKRLHSVGSPELVRAWLEGDWEAITGAFFTEFELITHVKGLVKIPASWTRFRSIDWGSYKPFAVGWFAVSDGVNTDFPKGSVIMYREYYGAAKDESGLTKPNTGLRLPPAEVALEILKRTGQDEKIAYTVCDPAMFKTQGGPSVAEQMRHVGLSIKPADNNRINGWNECRARLRGDESGPGFYILSNCVEAIRTLPALQHDPINPEDADSDGEDHCPDMIRYALMSRPRIRTYDVEEVKPKTLKTATLNDLWELRAEELTLGRRDYGF